MSTAKITNTERKIKLPRDGQSAHFDTIKTPNSGILDFSGYMNGTERVMGFMSLEQLRLKQQMKIDEDFIWRIPDNWTLEDSAAVPFYVSVAFYCLKLVMDLEAKNTVLIHSGYSILGQAAIAIALNVGSRVFTTIENEKQKEQLLNLFSKLDKENVFLLENNWFEDELLFQTSGCGVDIILSTVSGESFNSSLRCLALSGRIMQLNKRDTECGHKIGMGFFEKNTSVFVFDMNDLFMTSFDLKKEINKGVKELLEKGVIIQPQKQVFKFKSDFGKALEYGLNSNGDKKILMSVNSETEENVLSKYSYDFNKLQVVIGSGSQTWLNILEVLVKNGFRKIILVIDVSSISGSQSSRLNKLTSLYDVAVYTSSIQQLASLQTAKEFLQKILKLGLVDSIFISLKEADYPLICNLDFASHDILPKVKFISIMGAGSEICEKRLNVGRHGAAVVCSSESVKSHEITHLLEEIIWYCLEPKVLVLSAHQTTRYKGESSKKEVGLCLPKSLSELIMLNSCNDKYQFVEVNSLSPRMGDSQRVIPVFVVPGLSTTLVSSFTAQLMAPVFCAELPCTLDSASQAAEELIKSVLKIQPEGPYNIIGETWSGAIALELARQLEESGREVFVILLTAMPHSYQKLMNSFGSFNSFEFKQKLISMLLQLSPDIMDTTQQNKESSWDDYIIELSQNICECSNEVEPDELQTLIKMVISRVLSTLNYKCCSMKTSSVAIIHPNNGMKLETNLNELYGENTKVYLMDDVDHNLLLSSSKTTTLINDLIHYKK